MDSSLRNRLTFGGMMLAGLLAMLWIDHLATEWTQGLVVDKGQSCGLGGIGLLALLLLILPPATSELARLFGARHLHTYGVIAALGSGLLVVHAFLTQLPAFQPIAASTLAFLIVFVMLLAALRRAWAGQSQEAIAHMAGTVLATLYLGGLAWFLMALRVKRSAGPGGFHGSTMVIVMILLVVKSTDIGAFFGGRAIGRRRLIPWLSPGKTWEGLGCGVVLAAIVGMICARWIGVPDYKLLWWQGLLFGAIIGLVGQAGDLLESLLKRDAQVKDSGSLIPGFGGVLDVIDSPLLASPFAYLLFSLF